jgi:hypothetical protein
MNHDPGAVVQDPDRQLRRLSGHGHPDHREGADGWVLDLQQPTIVPRDQLDDRFFVRTTAAMQGERVDVTEHLDGRVTLRFERYPPWVADLDAPFDRNDWSAMVTDVPIGMLSELREYVTHYRS